jgi:hypothetical protein
VAGNSKSGARRQPAGGVLATSGQQWAVSVRLGVAEPVVALACSEMLLGGEPTSWPVALCAASTRNGYAARHSKARRRQEASSQASSSQQRLKGEVMQQRIQRLDLLVL